MRKKVKLIPDDSLFIESGRIAVGNFMISRLNALELFPWRFPYYFLPDKPYALY